MSKSIYTPHREKFEFTNPNLFRVGDEFKKLKIGITKYWDEQVPGYAPKLYKVHVSDSDKSYHEEFIENSKSNLNLILQLLEFVKSVIPEEELNAKKYNL